MPRLVLIAALLTLLAACGGPAALQPPAEPIANTALDLVLDAPSSAGFEVETNAAEDLRLRWPGDDESPAASLAFAVGEDEISLNLVEYVKGQEADLDSRPGGDFLGQLELGSHIGPAFITRGRFTGDDGNELEETKIFASHPDPETDRVLTITYVYPPSPGSTQARREQALSALGLVQIPGAEPTEESGG
ncbi:MAG: hypothetical protein AAF604_21010 [Acidobacteriota bacterium]